MAQTLSNQPRSVARFARNSPQADYQDVTVSIVIVVKNDRGIADTLSHLETVRADVPVEVIVIDASAPERLADIRTRHTWARWEQFPPSKQRTTAQQRNRGLDIAKGDIIVFIDANCIPTKGWLGAIVADMKGGEDIVCGLVLDSNERNLVEYDAKNSGRKYVEDCMTMNVGLRREVVERVGRFDTTFLFGQDVDFFWRARDAGFRILYDPAAAISHDWGMPKEQVRRAYDYGKARAHLYKKHWRRRGGQLLREPDAWAYAMFVLGLPVTIIFPVYPLLLLLPLIKNRSSNPLGLIVHHLAYGLGFLVGALKVWPRPTS